MRNIKSISVLPYSPWSFISHSNITKVPPLWTGVHKKSSKNIIHHLGFIKSHQKMGQFSRKDFKQNTKPASYCTLLNPSAVHWWPEPVRLTHLCLNALHTQQPRGPKLLGQSGSTVQGAGRTQCQVTVTPAATQWPPGMTTSPRWAGPRASLEILQALQPNALKPWRQWAGCRAGWQ